jgi:hypothetical protein
VSKCRVRGSSPFINSGSVSHSGHHVRLLTCSLRSDSSPVYSFIASRILCVVRDFSSSSSVTLRASLEVISCYLRLLRHWCIVHSRLLSILHSILICITAVTCTINLFNTFIPINLTIYFRRLEFKFLSVPTIPNHGLPLGLQEYRITILRDTT